MTMGFFTVSLAYNITIECTGNNRDYSWGRIWKLKVLNHICVFLWLVKHNRILTNVERNRGGLTFDESCTSCPGMPEDLNHLFRTCPKVASIWRATLPGVMGQDPNMHFNDWLTINIAKKDRIANREEWRVRFAITMWWLWKWENDTIFANRERSNEDKVGWIIKQCNDVSRAYTRTNMDEGIWQHTKHVWLRWEKPPRNWTKINSYGRVTLKDGSAGCGGVLRNEEGKWLCGYEAGVGKCTIAEA